MKINKQKCELLEIIFDEDEFNSVESMLKEFTIISHLYSGPVVKNYKTTGKFKRLVLVDKEV